MPLNMSDNYRQAMISIMEQTCGTSGIYEAMDSDDLANVVCAARQAFKSSGYTPQRSTKKSAEESIEFRKKGNLHYINGEYKEAILCFNKALAFAPKNSLEMKFAYANTSAAMLAIKAYQPCQANIKACHDLGCPQNLIEKLDNRMKQTEMFIMEEMMQCAPLHSSPVLNKYVEFDVPKNAEVPCASQDVHVQNNGSMKVASAREIKSGTIVAMEHAFVSTQIKDNQYTSCYNCHRIYLCFVPCEGCCQALFCTKECRDKCMDEYHRIECQIIEYLGSLYKSTEEKLMTRAAIKMSLKLNWDELSVASREMGKKRLKNSTVKQACDVNSPLSMLCYDDQKYAIQGKIFNGSITCAAVLDRLNLVPGYFPEDEVERKKAMDAMSRIMLHLYSTFTNRIEILCSAMDYKNKTMKCGVQRNYGWFSFTSKLAHSCEPNLFVVGLNDRVALVALQRIKKDEELTISYIDHFYDMLIMHSCSTHSLFRQKKIMSAIYYLCDCRVCVNEWDSNSQVDEGLTPAQINAFQKMIREIRNGKIPDKLKAASAGLDALTGAINTTQHKIAFQSLSAVGSAMIMDELSMSVITALVTVPKYRKLKENNIHGSAEWWTSMFFNYPNAAHLFWILSAASFFAEAGTT